MLQTENIIRPTKKFITPKKPQHPALPLRLMQFGFGTLGRVFPKAFANVAFHFFISPRNRAKHKISDAILEQATVSEMLVGKDMLKVYEWGSGEKTVLLVHGWESRGTALRSFIPKLLENGFRVVAFDAPAHGDSTGEKVDVVTYSTAVKALYQKSENVEAIICHSFGGASVMYAMTQLDPTMYLNKFVMIGTPSRIFYPIENALNTMNAPTQVRKHFIGKIEKITGVKLSEFTIEKLSTTLKIEKALIVHDQQDEQVDFAEAEKIVKHWKNAELQVTDGFGHFLLMKNPAVIERVVDFIVHP